jgi:hypothetical protein
MIFIGFTGTHNGEYQGMLPTNKPIEIRFADLYRTDNKRIMEHGDVVNQFEIKPNLYFSRLEGRVPVPIYF